MKILPSLLGQSRGAEVPRGGVIEFSVLVVAARKLLDVGDGCVELLDAAFVD